MKHLILVLLLLSPLMAFAFGASEKEQMREDVREALHRARDFSAQKVREATENLARERGAVEVKKKRAEFEAQQEELRRDYVTQRNAKPSDFLLQARLEREFEEKRIVEDRNMDRARGNYVRKRRQVQRIIETKARINENEEFGL
jgi:triphosphoribosyl-dephospho-CoA synthetase